MADTPGAQTLLAEIPYPRIDPVIFWRLRWYGVSYLVAFLLAYKVLHGLAKRKRWPIDPLRVGDVLFWGILGVFLGGRIGYVIVYIWLANPAAGMPPLSQWLKVWEGGMSFHGGLVGVVLAYAIYASMQKIRFRDLADGLALATPLGIFCVRIANFINAELTGRVWDGPWSMRFPIYNVDDPKWDGRWDHVTRHPSQLYNALGEGILLFFVLRWLMLKRGWAGGTVASAFLMCYGAIRFCLEFFREPDREIGYEFFGLRSGKEPLLWLTRGQELCLGMIAFGFLCWLLLKPKASTPTPPPPV